MIEITYRIDPDRPAAPRPADAAAARAALEAGNAAFVSQTEIAGDDAHYVIEASPADFGVHPEQPVPAHEPFAAVVGCADARVPIALVFSRRPNDLFVLRVAGNVLGTELLGSLDFALATLGSIRLVVVLGHTACGAVGAAVDAYCDPAAYLALATRPSLRRIVDQVFPAVRLAHEALRTSTPGVDRTTLVEAAVVVNAALVATTLQADIARRDPHVPVFFGIYDLATRRVSVPGGMSAGGSAPADDPFAGAARDTIGLAAAPPDAASLEALARRVAIRLSHAGGAG